MVFVDFVLFCIGLTELGSQRYELQLDAYKFPHAHAEQHAAWTARVAAMVTTSKLSSTTLAPRLVATIYEYCCHINWASNGPSLEAARCTKAQLRQTKKKLLQLDHTTITFDANCKLAQELNKIKCHSKP